VQEAGFGLGARNLEGAARQQLNVRQRRGYPTLLEELQALQDSLDAAQERSEMLESTLFGRAPSGAARHPSAAACTTLSDLTQRRMTMHEETKIATARDGRDVLVRYEEGWYYVVLKDNRGEEYDVRRMWPRWRAVRLAHSIAKDRFR
jgi:hypothetical protein